MKIVLFLLDALRYDTFRQCMPFLEDYAEGCLDYQNCISGGPYTKASLPWLLQGKETWEPEKPNLVSILRERNYQTAAIYSTPVLNDYAPVFDMALDVFELEHGPRLAALRKKYKGSKVWGTFRNMILGRGYLRAETMNKYAKTYLDQAPDDSFTWVHYMDTHIPWNAPNLGLSNSMEAEALNKKMRDAKWTTEGFSQDEIAKIQAQYRMEAFYPAMAAVIRE